MLSQRLRHRITIQEQEEEFTSYGEERGFVWVDWMADVPAEVLLGPGREPVAANAKQSEILARITIRWVEGLTQKMRILWDGRVFGIESLEGDATGRKEWWIKCGSASNGS